MSYFDDRFGGYVGREEHERAKPPTYEQMRTLEKLAETRKLTERQRDALKVLIAWERDS